MGNCRIVMIPGPTGPAGAAGTNGSNGASAFTTLSASFIMPVIGGTAVAEVADTSFMVAWTAGGIVYGQALAVEFGGVFLVVDVVDGTHVELYNGGWTGNALAGTTIPAGAKIGIAGVPGADGGPGGGDMLSANNLSDLANIITARANLGLGSMATQDAASVGITGGSIGGITDMAVADGGTGASTAAAARANLAAAGSGLATGSGLTVSATDVLVGRASAGAGALEEIPCTGAARTFLNYASVAAMLVGLGRVKPREGLLGLLTVDLNGAIADQNIPVTFTRAIIRQVVLENASVDLTGTATRFGIYTGSGKTGSAVVTDPFDPSALTAATKWIDVTLAAGVATDVVVPDIVNSRLYLWLSVAHGVAATANLWLFGQDLS